MFRHVLTDRDGVILIGSRKPLPLDRDAWRARLRASRRYLGAPRSGDIAYCIDGFGPLERRPPTPDLNDDLFPRDEFISPRAADQPSRRLRHATARTGDASTPSSRSGRP